MLELKSIDAGYGTFQALFGVSLDVKAGEAVGVASFGTNVIQLSKFPRHIAGLCGQRKTSPCARCCEWSWNTSCPYLSR